MDPVSQEDEHKLGANGREGATESGTAPPYCWFRLVEASYVMDGL